MSWFPFPNSFKYKESPTHPCPGLSLFYPDDIIIPGLLCTVLHSNMKI